MIFFPVRRIEMDPQISDHSSITVSYIDFSERRSPSSWSVARIVAACNNL